MLNNTFWVAMGVVATLVCAFVAHRIGRIQISWMRRSHEISAKLAACKIGTSVQLERRAPNIGRPDIHRWFMVTTIYNEGDCAAQKLHGDWNLSCSEKFQNRKIPIRVDFLRATKFELPLQDLGDSPITQAQSSGKFWAEVDIKFSYLGLDENKPEKYTAKYQFDKNSNQMKQV